MPGYVTLYLDESGEKTWPPPWGNSNTRYYALAGLVLTPIQDKIVHERVPAILSKFFPEPLTRPTEIHYGDLINKRGAYGGLSDPQRKSMADDVFALIGEVRPTLMGTVVRKDWMKTRYGTAAHAPNEYALRASIERFDRHLEETNNLGMAIMDTEGFTADHALRELVHSARTTGIKLGGINYVPGSDRKLNYVLNSVGFSPSQMSPGIQLADFVAYAVFSHFERQRSERFNSLDRHWRRSGTFREPSVLPSRG